MASSSPSFRRLGATDIPLLRKLNALLGDAFGDRETYEGEPPTDAYLEGLLSKEHVIVLVALVDDEVLGGLVAYELDKFERRRREIYIYDLAVDTGVIAHPNDSPSEQGRQEASLGTKCPIGSGLVVRAGMCPE
jgi:hypothetical protein